MSRRKYTRRDGAMVPLAVVIAENVLGRRLPKGAIVHHADGDFTNDATDNLVICPDKAYHNLIHSRLDAMKACGNPNWVKCQYCQQYGPEDTMFVTRKNGRRAWHNECNAAYSLAGYYRRKEASK